MILPNDPDLWRANFPEPTAKDHKYSRGHTAIFGANTYTARPALRQRRVRGLAAAW